MHPPSFYVLIPTGVPTGMLRLRAKYAARVLQTREGKNTHDEQLRIAQHIKNEEIIIR